MVPITLFFYAFVLIVLINLLIAAMTETYQRLREASTLYYLCATTPVEPLLLLRPREELEPIAWALARSVNP